MGSLSQIQHIAVPQQGGTAGDAHPSRKLCGISQDQFQYTSPTSQEQDQGYGLQPQGTGLVPSSTYALWKSTTMGEGCKVPWKHHLQYCGWIEEGCQN